LTGWDFSYPLVVIRGSAEFERLVHSCLADPAERRVSRLCENPGE